MISVEIAKNGTTIHRIAIVEEDGRVKYTLHNEDRSSSIGWLPISYNNNPEVEIVKKVLEKVTG